MTDETYKKWIPEEKRAKVVNYWDLTLTGVVSYGNATREFTAKGRNRFNVLVDLVYQVILAMKEPVVVRINYIGGLKDQVSDLCEGLSMSGWQNYTRGADGRGLSARRWRYRCSIAPKFYIDLGRKIHRDRFILQKGDVLGEKK